MKCNTYKECPSGDDEAECRKKKTNIKLLYRLASTILEGFLIVLLTET